MTDKKLTDSEIVKTLESYINDITCAKCGFKDQHLLGIIISALDLINRLQAENERLRKSNTEMFVTISRQSADIDKLNGWVNSLEELWETKTALLTNANDSLLTAKAEAYKEFAEKVKEKTKWLFSAVSINNEIDNLLKEMVGDSNAKEKE